MYYRHQLDYTYPDRCDQHMITVPHLRDVTVDEHYPYLRKDVFYKCIRAFYWVAMHTLLAVLLPISHGLRIYGRENLRKHRDLLKNGAVGFITYDGNANYTDDDIDQRELRSYVSMGEKIPGVNINAKSAIRIINENGIMAKIVLKQTETMGNSHNVVLDLPGEIPEMLIFSAHYDSTSLSQGAYDNMSGSIGLLGIAEYFLQHPHRYSLRFVWCGSEERGLLGSKAYTEAHADELEQLVLNINLDMIGSIMGGLTVRCTAEEKVVHYLEYLAAELGVSLSAKQEIHSSDSTSFADKGIPAVSFARRAPSNTATIHNAYDTKAVLKAAHLQADIAFITAFAQRMANASRCPVSREIPENMKEKLDIYLLRKRG